MDSLFSLESKTEGRIAARLKDFGVFNNSHKASPFGAGAVTPSSMLKGFIRLLLSDTKMVYGELVLKGFIVSVQNHLNLLNQLHNAISFLNFGLFFFLA